MNPSATHITNISYTQRVALSDDPSRILFVREMVELETDRPLGVTLARLLQYRRMLRLSPKKTVMVLVDYTTNDLSATTLRGKIRKALVWLGAILFSWFILISSVLGGIQLCSNLFG